jgi:hypothetical protein
MEPFAPLPKVKSATVRKDRPTHIDHIEDRFIRLGDTELFYTLRTLTEVHNRLVASMEDKSYKSSLILTEKFDGSPSIVFGHDKETGRFFVATKSFFSKTPKLNFTPDDIRLHYGYSQNLVDKMIAALTHLPKITPETGIFQGDLMYEMIRTARSLGAQKIIAFGPAVWPRWIGRLGLKAEPAGPVMELDGVRVQVAVMNLDPRLH